MPIACTFNAERNAVVIPLYSGYQDRLSRWSDIQEYLSFLYEHLPIFVALCLELDAQKIIELGVRDGISTVGWLHGVEQTGGHVWSVDPADCDGNPEGMKPWRRTSLWTFIRGSDMDDEIRAQLPTEVDVLFIDTSHEYEHTLAELRAYVPMVVPGGIVLCHDTNLFGWPGYEPPGKLPPVQQALDEYCAETRLEWRNLAGEYGLGVIAI